MRSTFKVLFYVKKGSEKPNGNLPLMCRITVDGEIKQFSCKMDVPPRLWDVKNNRASGKSVEAQRINLAVDKIRVEVNRRYQELMQTDGYVTAAKLKDAYLGIGIKQETLLKLFEQHNAEFEKKVGHSRAQGTFTRYRTVCNHIREFLPHSYKREDIPLKELNLTFINDFEYFLRTEKKCRTNTVWGYMIVLKHIVSIARNDGRLPFNPFAGYINSPESVDRGYLTRTEIQTLMDIFIPGETVADPPCLPQDWDSLYAATLASIRNPIGMPPLKELAGPGKSVVIVIPDIVKGGNQPTSHRKVAIRACLDELYAAGVEQKDVLLLFSNGLHPRATVAEMQTILGPELFGEFYPTGQITSHDSEDYDHLVDLGYTAQGDHVIMNKYVYDADVAVLIGHTQGNPYGGYSGGYKHCATGISHWRSISAHHVPQVMHRQDFVPVSTNSEMRHKFDQQGMLMEEKMGKKFFCCDAVLDTKSRQIEINSGWAREMQPVSWKMADKRTYVHWAEKKYDIIVFGMPTNFHYGNGMGTNPIQMMQALSAQVIRHRRIMSDRCVFIVSSICDGYFHDERWPYLRELYDLFQHDYMNILPDMNRYGEYFATKEEYIRKYRFANAFHPFHGFSMMSCGHLAEEHTSAIYIVGAREPGIARSMGLKTRATFEEALADAMRKYTGPNPNILALPRTFTTAAVHLCMKDPALNSAPVGGTPCGG